MCSLSLSLFFYSHHVSISSDFYLASTFPLLSLSCSLFQPSTVLLLMPLTGGYLHPYMFSLQLYHGSSVVPNISALCWWSPLWGVLPDALHYIFPLFRFFRRGLCHLAVLGPKWYLTPDNSSNHHHHNIASGIISCGDLFLSSSSGHERQPEWNNELWQICCTSSQTTTPFFFSPRNPHTF